jgi:hypothetical protein
MQSGYGYITQRRYEMTTTITHFDRISLGNEVPALLSVERIAIDGMLIASFHNFTTEGNNNTKAELRTKQNEYALFLYQYSDSELPGWWMDSDLIWSIGPNPKEIKCTS